MKKNRCISLDIIWFHLYEISRNRKSRERKISHYLGLGWEWDWEQMGMRQLLGVELLKLDCGGAVKLCECMKNHWMVHFFWYLNYTLRMLLKITFTKMRKLLVYEICLIRTLRKSAGWQWNWIKNGKKKKTCIILAWINKMIIRFGCMIT